MDLNDLQWNYTDLLKYKLGLNRLINHNKGIMEISYPYFFSYLETSSISDSISPKINAINKLLAMFIDPHNKSYSQEEMVREFNFPTEDLLDIDIDWM